MANQERGELAITVKGKVYTLRPTFDALCELETLVDKPIDQVLAGIADGRLSGLRAVVWCFLQDAHATEIVTLKHASQWIEKAGGTDLVLAAVHRVLGLNVDAETPPAGADPHPPAAQAGTGEASSSVLVGSA